MHHPSIGPWSSKNVVTPLEDPYKQLIADLPLLSPATFDQRVSEIPGFDVARLPLPCARVKLTFSHQEKVLESLLMIMISKSCDELAIHALRRWGEQIGSLCTETETPLTCLWRRWFDGSGKEGLELTKAFLQAWPPLVNMMPRGRLETPLYIVCSQIWYKHFRVPQVFASRKAQVELCALLVKSGGKLGPLPFAATEIPGIEWTQKLPGVLEKSLPTPLPSVLCRMIEERAADPWSVIWPTTGWASPYDEKLEGEEIQNRIDFLTLVLEEVFQCTLANWTSTMKADATALKKRKSILIPRSPTHETGQRKMVKLVRRQHSTKSSL